MSSDIEDQIDAMQRVIGAKAHPEIQFGPHCDNHYTCALHDYCWSFLPEASVFTLYHGGAKCFSLLQQGIQKVADIPPDVALTDNQAIQRAALLAGHPVTPVRVRALQLYRDAGGASADALKLGPVDAEVMQLARLMERTPTEPEDIHKLNYVVAGGVLLGYADGKGLGERELRCLVDILMPLTSDPEESIAAITSIAQAEQMLTESAAWMKKKRRLPVCLSKP